MPLLFNRWRDPVCDFGGVCLEHIVPGLSNLSGGLDLFGDPDDPARVPPLIERLHRGTLRRSWAHMPGTSAFSPGTCATSR